eukprot:351511-Chlamydomonas_euryale.AAC.2
MVANCHCQQPRFRMPACAVSVRCGTPQWHSARAQKGRLDLSRLDARCALVRAGPHPLASRHLRRHEETVHCFAFMFTSTVNATRARACAATLFCREPRAKQCSNRPRIRCGPGGVVWHVRTSHAVSSVNFNGMLAFECTNPLTAPDQREEDSGLGGGVRGLGR